MMLAFVPVDDVESTFFHLLDLVPTTEELGVDLDPFLSYFQTNWITGVGTA